jgi:hypothetical protein
MIAIRRGIAPRMREMAVRSQITIVAAQVFGAIVLLSPNMPVGRVPSEDAGVFLYVAGVISGGGMPYRDVWDHKPPGVYLLDVLAAGNLWGVFALQAITLVAASLLAYRALEQGGFGPLAAAFGTVAWMVALPRLFLEDGLQTNFAEVYALPAQFAALGLFAADEKTTGPSWRTAAIGALGGAAALLKPTLIGMWIAIALVLVVTRANSRRWSDLARRAAVIAFPAAFVVSLVVAWLAIGGALADAIDQVLRYNAVYSGFASPLDRLDAVAIGLRLTLPSGLAPLAVAGWLVALRGRRSPLVLVAVVALPIELLLASAGRGYHYYFIAWLPPMAVLAAHLADRFLARFGARLVFAIPVACVVMAIVPTLLVGRLIQTGGSPAAREAAAYITTATQADDAVLVWGSHTEVLVLADRRSPTRFVYQYAAVATRSYASAAQIDELIADLERTKPILILDTSKDSFVTPPLDRAGLASWTSPEPQYAWPEGTSRIVRFVETNYERIQTLGQSGWPVFRLRSR